MTLGVNPTTTTSPPLPRPSTADCLSSELYKDTALAECIPTCDNPVIAKSCYRDDSETCRCSNPSDVMIGGKCSSLAECACVDPFGRTTRVSVCGGGGL